VSYPLKKAALPLLSVLLVLPVGVRSAFGAPPDSPQPPASTARVPYVFSNFAWWTDDQLRAELKERIPSLQADLTCGSAQEAKVRDALTAMLLAKGVHATVVSTDPSDVSTKVSDFVATLPFFIPGRSDQRPHIVFSISAPEIVIGAIQVAAVPDSQSDVLGRIAHQMEGKPFDSNTLDVQAHQLAEPMEHSGYLSASISLSAGQPELHGSQYLVPLEASVDAGPQYHVGMVSADGGPLLRGRDLSTYFDLLPGEVATPYAFQRLENSIMTIYFQSGFTSVHFMDTPILDRDHAIATYRLQVLTGPQYRLRTLTVHNLSPAQEAEVRTMLALVPGDVYDQLAIDELHQKVQDSANLHGLDYSFEPQTDRQNNEIDLTLDFFKESAQAALQISGAGS